MPPASGCRPQRPRPVRLEPTPLAKHFGGTEAEEYLRQQTAWAKGLPVRWFGNGDRGTALSDDGLYVTNSRGMHCLSTERPLPAGLERYFFEINCKPAPRTAGPQSRHPLTAIGFCTRDASVLDFPGWPPRAFAPSARSWSYHGDDGGFYSSSCTPLHGNEDYRYKAGDTVGCGFDWKLKSIWFTRNGELLLPAIENVTGRMFPVIGLEHAAALETNFGAKPFAWQGGTMCEEVPRDSMGQSVVPGPPTSHMVQDEPDTLPGAGPEKG